MRTTLKYNPNRPMHTEQSPKHLQRRTLNSIPITRKRTEAIARYFGVFITPRTSRTYGPQLKVMGTSLRTYSTSNKLELISLSPSFLSISSRKKTTRTFTSYRPSSIPKLHLNRQDPNDPSPNVPNANDTGTLKHTATTPHVVSNAPGATLLLIVPAKINLTWLHVSYAVVIIQQITKAVLFTKSYRNELSHRSIHDRKPNVFKKIRHSAQRQLPPMRLPSAPPQTHPCITIHTHPRILRPRNFISPILIYKS